MSEQESMDALLRDAMGRTPQPVLSPSFERRLAARVRPRRLDLRGRRLLGRYALTMLAFSVAVMRSQSLDWSLIAVAIVTPVALVTTAAVSGRARRRTRRPASRVRTPG